MPARLRQKPVMTEFLISPQGRTLAYRQHSGASGRNFVWLSGFNSDMQGTKVVQLERWAAARGHGFLAFDYCGHGQSGGQFADCTITHWHEDTLAVLDTLCKGPQILVGSSMGGWTALLAALARPKRVEALVLIAPAPDFTSRLMWPGLSPQAQREIQQTGLHMLASDYGEPVPISRALIESGKQHEIMGAPITFSGPVRIFQGLLDADVPADHSRRLVDLMTSDDIVFTLVKDGDHRLSRDQDIKRLITACTELAGSR